MGVVFIFIQMFKDEVLFSSFVHFTFSHSHQLAYPLPDSWAQEAQVGGSITEPQIQIALKYIAFKVLI